MALAGPNNGGPNVWGLNFWDQKRLQTVYHIEMARNQVSDQKKSLEPDLNSETQTTKIPKVMVNINEASDANKAKNCHFGRQKDYCLFCQNFQIKINFNIAQK